VIDVDAHPLAGVGQQVGQEDVRGLDDLHQ